MMSDYLQTEKKVMEELEKKLSPLGYHVGLSTGWESIINKPPNGAGAYVCYQGDNILNQENGRAARGPKQLVEQNWLVVLVAEREALGPLVTKTLEALMGLEVYPGRLLWRQNCPHMPIYKNVSLIAPLTFALQLDI